MSIITIWLHSEDGHFSIKIKQMSKLMRSTDSHVQTTYLLKIYITVFAVE